MIRSFKDKTPIVEVDAYVDLSAQVIGDVEIGAESSIWMNVVIRGDVNGIRIGRRTNIQDLTMVHVMRGTHPTTIGNEVTEGTRIPARSLVMGRPGKVKRQLTDEEVGEIRWYSDSYVKYRLDYMS